MVGAAELFTACKKDDPKPSKALAVPTTAPKPPEKKLPWYAGAWSGTYKAEAVRLEMTAAEGAVKEWEEDDGTALAGEGSLKLAIAEDRTVSGHATGALGDLVAAGEMDGDTLRVRLSPKSPATAEQVGRAIFIAKRKDEKLEGKLHASSGNALKVRIAQVTLSKVEAAQASPPSAPETKKN
jgi:hypothetical protein